MLGLELGLGFLFVFAVVLIAIREEISDLEIHNSLTISESLNPKEAIGYSDKHIQANYSGSLEQGIQKTKQELDEEQAKLKKTQDDEEKNRISANVNKLAGRLQKLEQDQQEMREASKQRLRIDEAIKSLLKPYADIEKNIEKLKIHNWCFYAGIAACLTLASFYIYYQWQLRLDDFRAIIKTAELTGFGNIFGVVVFYATPLLLLLSLLVYFIAQVNKNLQQTYLLQSQQRSIKILQSALDAQTHAGVKDEELEAAIKQVALKVQEIAMASINASPTQANPPSQQEASLEAPFINRKVPTKELANLVKELLKKGK